MTMAKMNDWAPAVQRRAGRRGIANLGILLAAGLAMIGLDLGEAYAQYRVERGQTVFQRPRPDYDPIGISVGGFTFNPFIDVTQSYNDNLFATNNNKEDDFSTTARVGGRLTSNWSRHRMFASAYAAADRYWDNTSEDAEYWGGAFGSRADMTERDTLTGTLNYDRAVVDRGDPENTADDDPEEVDRIAAGLAYEHRFNRITVGLGGRIQRSNYINSRDRDQDRVEARVAPRVSYVPSPNISYFVEPFYSTRKYDRKRDFTGLERDADEVGFFVGTGYDITGIITGESSVGYYTVSYDDGRFDDNSGLALRSSTTWNVTALTSLIGRISREDVATTSANSPSKTVTSLGIEVQHELLRNVQLSGLGRFQKEDFEDINTTDDYYTFGVGAEYLINRNFRVGADYLFRQRDSDIADQDYLQNQLMLTFRAVM